MIALYIFGGFILLLLFLLFLRIGVEIAWGEDYHLLLRVGIVRKQLLPKQSKPPEKKAGKKEQTAEPAKKPKEKKKFHPSFEDITALFPAAKESLQKGLRKTRKRVKIDPLMVVVTFGGDDPAEVAQHYGRANAAMWSIMPEAERLTRMPDPHIHLGMDYEAKKTVSFGKAALSLQIRDVFAIALAFGLPLYRWYRKAAKAQKSTEAKNEKNGCDNIND